jgi:hypothetical protein
LTCALLLRYVASSACYQHLITAAACAHLCQTRHWHAARRLLVCCMRQRRQRWHRSSAVCGKAAAAMASGNSALHRMRTLTSLSDRVALSLRLTRRRSTAETQGDLRGSAIMDNEASTCAVDAGKPRPHCRCCSIGVPVINKSLINLGRLKHTSNQPTLPFHIWYICLLCYCVVVR